MVSATTKKDIAEKRGKLAAQIAGWQVLVLRDESGMWHALNDRCTHQAALLSGGRVRRGALMCPLHGARFDVASGKCLGGAYPDLRTFPVRVAEGGIELGEVAHLDALSDAVVT
jgi:nitrite reductase/ring-hydroxylating ferredoxin subunit